MIARAALDRHRNHGVLGLPGDVQGVKDGCGMPPERMICRQRLLGERVDGDAGEDSALQTLDERSFVARSAPVQC